MELSAINHDASKKNCYALHKGRFVFRIKTKKNDIIRIVLHYQDKYIDTQIFDTRQKAGMQKFASDSLCDYYEAEIDMDVICLRYYFELTDALGKTCYYGNYDFTDCAPTDPDRMFDCPQALREEEMLTVPAWAGNKVVYQIFPARFASSQRVDENKWYKLPVQPREDLGGDLRGIINHLDHFRDLGADVLYMTPIFASPSTHKYDTIDYYKIDPGFGTEADLRELVDKAHEMGIKIILDGVFNHTSTNFFAFQDILKNQSKSAYKDWYYLEGFPLVCERGKKPNYKTFGYHGGMPKLNLQNPETAEYFIRVGRYWIENCHIDGWRLDVGDEIGHNFWRKFRREMKRVNPEALITGEVWHYAEDFLNGDEWDSVMNYPFYFSVRDFVAEETITASKFWENLNYLYGNLHTNVIPVLWNLLGSHDTDRFLSVCGKNYQKMKLAAALQLLLPGMPVIYYGDEYGLTGSGPDCRRGMAWDGRYQNQDIYRWYRALIQVRKQYRCITEGTTADVQVNDAEGILCFTKKLGEEKAVVCFHARQGLTNLPQFAGMTNILRETSFDGILKDYEAVVLCQ